MDENLKTILEKGNLQIPLMVFEKYHQFGITNEEFLVLLQIAAFKQIGVMIPNTKFLSQRTGLEERAINSAIKSLINKEIVALNEDNTSFVFDGLYAKALNIDVSDDRFEVDNSQLNSKQSMYRTFENEIGRELSPIEIKTITDWIDIDNYNPELIKMALETAVLNQKVSLKYIGAILNNWKQKGVRNTDEAEIQNAKFKQNNLKVLPEKNEPQRKLNIPDPKKPIGM